MFLIIYEIFTEIFIDKENNLKPIWEKQML